MSKPHLTQCACHNICDDDGGCFDRGMYSCDCDCEPIAVGIAAGLDAAREAMEGCRTDFRGYLGKSDALAAIDALREETK